MSENMQQDVLRVLLSEEEIRAKCKEMGARISQEYKGKNLMLVTVLKGAVVFLADLMRAIDVPAEIDFMVVSSYGSGVKSSGVVKIVKDLDVPPGRQGPSYRGGYPRFGPHPQLYQRTACQPRPGLYQNSHAAG